MEKILFPMPTMNITTGINVASHKGSNAIDNAGEDSGIDNVVAPFTGIIKKIWPNGNTVWLESLNPVLYADGTQDYATVNFTHDNYVGDLKVGDIIPQGKAFYQEGTAGNATGNHLHLEIGKGKFAGTGWYQNSFGNWVITNSYVPYNAFWLDNVRIINGYGYIWKTTEGDEAMIADKDNEYNRWRALGFAIRGRDLTREEFRISAVGKTWLTAMEILQDNAEATAAQAAQDIGQTAVRDKWEQQIYDLQDQVTVRDGKIGELTTELEKKPTEVVVEKPVEVIKEVVKGDDERSLGDLLSAAFKKLFKIK